MKEHYNNLSDSEKVKFLLCVLEEVHEVHKDEVSKLVQENTFLNKELEKTNKLNEYLLVVQEYYSNQNFRMWAWLIVSSIFFLFLGSKL